MTITNKRHHRSAKPSNHKGRDVVQTGATKRWEHVTCGTCLGNRARRKVKASR